MKYSDTAYKGDRPYQDSRQLIQEIIDSGPAGVDPQGKGGLSWIVEGTMLNKHGKTVHGVYELILSPDGTTIWHFLFKGGQ